MGSVLSEGLKCHSSGSKSDDTTQKVDNFLDLYIPNQLRKMGVSRSSCVYGYLGNTETIIDIKNGSRKPVSEFIAKPKMALLKLGVNEERCFVSDLNTYDKVKATFRKGASPSPSQAHTYWKSLIPFSHFIERSNIRPEAMIPYNIPPEDIQIVT